MFTITSDLYRRPLDRRVLDGYDCLSVNSQFRILYLVLSVCASSVDFCESQLTAFYGLFRSLSEINGRKTLNM
jgi:hypothetical protein